MLDTRELIRRLLRPLDLLDLRDLQALRDRLQVQSAEQEARLRGVEQRKTMLFADGLQQASRLSQQAQARQIQVLDAEADQLAALLRLTRKQHTLVNRLIWARENLITLQHLAAAAPMAVPVDWPALVDATAALPDEEARLDELNQALAETGANHPDLPAIPSESAVGTTAKPPGRTIFQVMRVLDGATIQLAGGQTVRYIGIQAPSLRNFGREAEPGSWEAREANRQLVANRRVRLEADDLENDTDGAWWRYVYFENTFVNLDLLRQGVVYFQNRYPNLRHSEALLHAQQEARQRRRGLWKNDSR